MRNAAREKGKCKNMLVGILELLLLFRYELFMVDFKFEIDILLKRIPGKLT